MSNTELTILEINVKFKEDGFSVVQGTDRFTIIKKQDSKEKIVNQVLYDDDYDQAKAEVLEYILNDIG